MADAEQTLRDLLHQVADEHNWDPNSIKTTPISSEGANYTTTLFTASANAPDREDKLFAKVAIIGEQLREKMNADRFFQIEKYFYNDLQKVYKAIEEEHNLLPEHRLYFPKCYAQGSEQRKETLVLEDLTAAGYGSYDRVKPVSLEYAREAIGELAKLHSLSFAYKARQPEEFAKAAEFVKVILPPESHETEAGFKLVLGGATAAAREDNLPVVQSFFSKIIKSLGKFKGPGQRTVLAHGDYRVSNLMHRERDGKIQIVPVDYQTVHTGNAVSDLLYFLFTGTDGEFRRLHYKDLLHHYHEELSNCLQRLGLDVNTTYPRTDYEEDLKQMQPLVTVIAMLVLPLVLVNAENAPKMTGNVEDMAIKPTSLYSDRLNEVIDDLVEWGAVTRDV